MPEPVSQPTTAQSLGALLKSVRDIMRVGEVRLTEEKFKPAFEPALPLARLGRQVRRHHRRRIARLHQQRRAARPDGKEIGDRTVGGYDPRL